MLWHILVRAVPGAVAICIMGTHFHLLHRIDCADRLRDAMSAHARWLNHRRGRRGRLWKALDAPTHTKANRLARETRYIALNPCRAGLVRCPLAWPFSSHRDAVGLTLAPMRNPVHGPHRHHAYVSADPSTDVAGTQFPAGPIGPLDLSAVRAAVSEALRTPIARIHQRSPARRLFIQTARALRVATHQEISHEVRITRRRVGAVDQIAPADLAVVSQLLGDPRFPGLRTNDPRLRSGR